MVKQIASNLSDLSREIQLAPQTARNRGIVAGRIEIGSRLMVDSHGCNSPWRALFTTAACSGINYEVIRRTELGAASSPFPKRTLTRFCHYELLTSTIRMLMPAPRRRLTQ